MNRRESYMSKRIYKVHNCTKDNRYVTVLKRKSRLTYDSFLFEATFERIPKQDDRLTLCIRSVVKLLFLSAVETTKIPVPQGEDPLLDYCNPWVQDR